MSIVRHFSVDSVESVESNWNLEIKKKLNFNDFFNDQQYLKYFKYERNIRDLNEHTPTFASN